MTAALIPTAVGAQLPAQTQETASSAVAAQARAEVEARTVMALRRPRDMDDVRERLLKECRRPRFAQVARYRIPRGGKLIEGPSIRFAEAALRCMWNVLVQTPTIYDDHEKRIVRVIVSDLEANASYSKDITIAKNVERQKVGKDQVILSQRQNSLGNLVYLVSATDDDLRMKEASEVSRAIRTLFLRLLPGDILDEAMDDVAASLRAGFDADPDAERKRHADAFASIGVPPSALKEYLGHNLSLVTQQEAAELEALFAAIRDGETTFRAALEAKRGGAPGGVDEPAKPKGAAERLKAKLTKPPVGASQPAAHNDGIAEAPEDDQS